MLLLGRGQAPPSSQSGRYTGLAQWINRLTVLRRVYYIQAVRIAGGPDAHSEPKQAVDFDNQTAIP